MLEMRKAFLPRDWEEKIIHEDINTRMGEYESFDDYSLRVVTAASVIFATPFRRTDAMLHDALRMNWSTALGNAMKELPVSEYDRIMALEDIDQWIQAVEAVDSGMRTRLKVIIDHTNEQTQLWLNDAELRFNKRQRTSYEPNNILS